MKRLLAILAILAIFTTPVLAGDFYTENCPEGIEWADGSCDDFGSGGEGGPGDGGDGDGGGGDSGDSGDSDGGEGEGEGPGPQ